MSTYTEDELHALSRKELQKIAKEHGLKANKKSSDLICEILQQYSSMKPSEEIIPDTETQVNALANSPAFSDQCVGQETEIPMNAFASSTFQPDHAPPPLITDNSMNQAMPDISEPMGIPEVYFQPIIHTENDNLKFEVQEEVHESKEKSTEEARLSSKGQEEDEEIHPVEQDFVIGDKIEVFHEHLWCVCDVKRVNKKTLRVLLPSTNEQITVPFTKTRRIVINETKIDSDLDVSLMEDTDDNAKPEETVHFTVTVDTFLQSYESSPSQKPESFSIMTNCPSSPEEPIVSVPKTPSRRVTPTILPKSNRATDLRADSIRKKSLSNAAVKSKLFQDYSAMLPADYLSKPEVVEEPVEIPKLVPSRLSRRLSFSAARAQQEMNSAVSDTLTTAEAITTNNNDTPCDTTITTETTTSSVAVAHTCTNSSRKLSTNGMHSKRKSVEKSHPLVKKSVSLSKPVSKHNTSIRKTSSVAPVAANSVAVKTSHIAPQSVGMRVSHIPVRSSVVPSTVRVSTKMMKSDISGTVAERNHKTVSKSVSVKPKISFVSTAEKCVRSATHSTTPVSISSVISDKDKTESISKLTHKNVSVTNPVSVPAPNSAVKSKIRCPDFKKMHAKTFSGQKAITDLVQRNNEISMKMTGALAAAQGHIGPVTTAHSATISTHPSIQTKSAYQLGKPLNLTNKTTSFGIEKKEEKSDPIKSKISARGSCVNRSNKENNASKVMNNSSIQGAPRRMSVKSGLSLKQSTEERATAYLKTGVTKRQILMNTTRGK